MSERFVFFSLCVSLDDWFAKFDSDAAILRSHLASYILAAPQKQCPGILVPARIHGEMLPMRDSRSKLSITSGCCRSGRTGPTLPVYFSVFGGIPLCKRTTKWLGPVERVKRNLLRDNLRFGKVAEPLLIVCRSNSSHRILICFTRSVTWSAICIGELENDP